MQRYQWDEIKNRDQQFVVAQEFVDNQHNLGLFDAKKLTLNLNCRFPESGEKPDDQDQKADIDHGHPHEQFSYLVDIHKRFLIFPRIDANIFWSVQRTSQAVGYAALSTFIK
jgi:hypothetical protein